ncbi:hypothetical protein L3Q82_005299 [Scortum barcoo]|uniref:Uncharacterized protein n=1 Tax=Scortum barcoo TaxID=214431 RepID=A0ACB8VA05_9TELE|nr:hypothetical protein L3Q82_005299 [Scortum barcoo]
MRIPRLPGRLPRLHHKRKASECVQADPAKVKQRAVAEWPIPTNLALTSSSPTAPGPATSSPTPSQDGSVQRGGEGAGGEHPSYLQGHRCYHLGHRERRPAGSTSSSQTPGQETSGPLVCP